MSVYIVIFERYPAEAKIGKSTNFKRRLRDHVKSHGPVAEVLEFISADEKKDSPVERRLLSSCRETDWSNVNTASQLRKGWTEFIRRDRVADAVKILESEGYVRTDFSADDIDNTYAVNSGVHEIKRAISRLALIDSLILTPLIHNRPFPETFAGYNKMLEDLGEGGEWLNEQAYEIAKGLVDEYPHGVLR